MINDIIRLNFTRNVKTIQTLPNAIAHLHQSHTAVSNEEFKKNNSERRKKKDERRISNEPAISNDPNFMRLFWTFE
jgi:hypothetical protein